jgi:hypothetical protein
VVGETTTHAPVIGETITHARASEIRARGSTMSDQSQLPSDAELFKQAMAPEPAKAPEPKPAEQPPPPAPSGEAPDGRGAKARDPDTGRFTAKAEVTPPPAEPPPAAAPPPPEPQQQQPDSGLIPSAVHRDMREQRDAAEQRARQMEMLMMQQQQRLQAMEQQFQRMQQPQQPQQIPDVITDPNGYHQFMMAQIEQRDRAYHEQLRNNEANTSFRLAHRDHGEVFEQAYVAMIQRAERGDPSIVRQVMQSQDPGEVMVRWFKQERNRQLVGDDPETWAETRHKERLEKDPQYRAQQFELLRSMAPASTNGAPNVQLPPSLNSVAASAPVVPNTAGQLSDAQIFDHAFRKGR